MTLEIDGIDATLQSGLGGGEPNLVSARRPGETLFSLPSGRKGGLVSGKIHERDDTTVVHVDWVVKEGDLIAIGRDAGMADPTGSFVEDVADGEFKTLPAAYGADDGEGFSIGSPICPVNITRLSGEARRR